MNIGFIGTGVMGNPMAGHLQSAGHQLFLLKHKSALPDTLIVGGAEECKTAKEVAEKADITILMLPDTPDVEAVLFAPAGVADGLSEGKTVIDMSSIDPIATREFAAKITTLKCDYVDAPVSGGEIGAKAASLTIMVGATQPAFEKVSSLFELMGKNITLIGDPGSGQIAKVANQIIVALNIEAVAEALVFASKAGADPARVRDALMGGFASSKILEVHGERMLKKTLQPGFRIELHQKDLNLALSSAKKLNMGLPNTASTQQLFSLCAAHGGSKLDHSALIQAIEMMANHKIG